VSKFKLSLLVGLLVAGSFRSIRTARALESEMGVDLDVTYEVLEDGKTKVEYEVSLMNKTTESYASGFELMLMGMHPEKIRAYDGTHDFKYEIVELDGKKRLVVGFDGDPVVGKGNSREFRIDFVDSSLVERTGEVWEVTVPGIAGAGAVESYNLELEVPKEFGNLAYLAPDPLSKVESEKSWHYFYGLSEMGESGITAAFGEFQVFSFELLYHLENPINDKSEIEVAIPPDTAFQKVIYQKLNPVPIDVRLDSDGNWLAKYVLLPRQRIDLSVMGSVQIYAKPREFIKPSLDSLQKNILPTEYWQSDNREILNIASKLNNPQEIYDYVVESLAYDYDRVKPNNRRQGALGVLGNPQSATCMEFTDLFISLARAKGIPAREVNGYVYTENSVLQPLSLVADVLHSWPEYWDSEQMIWRGVDPTWGNTTGGVDFFSKLDLRHFVFVIHGESADKPYPPGSYKLGPNPQKDVLVQFDKLPEERNSKLSVEIEKRTKFPIGSVNYEVNFHNSGPVAIYNVPASLMFDDTEEEKFNITVVPPFGTYKKMIKVPAGVLGINMPMRISVTAGDEFVGVSTDKEIILASVLVVVLLLIFAIAAHAVKRYRHARKH